MEWLYKVGSECELKSWPEKPVRASEQSSVVYGSNPTQANLL